MVVVSQANHFKIRHGSLVTALRNCRIYGININKDIVGIVSDYHTEDIYNICVKFGGISGKLDFSYNSCLNRPRLRLSYRNEELKW